MLKNNTNTTAFKTTRQEHQRLTFKFRTDTLCLETIVFPKKTQLLLKSSFKRVDH